MESMETSPDGGDTARPRSEGPPEEPDPRGFHELAFLGQSNASEAEPELEERDIGPEFDSYEDLDGDKLRLLDRWADSCVYRLSCVLSQSRDCFADGVFGARLKSKSAPRRVLTSRVFGGGTTQWLQSLVVWCFVFFFEHDERCHVFQHQANLSTR